MSVEFEVVLQAFVARRLQSDPIAFIAATRDERDGPLDSVSLIELRVEPLDDADAATLLDGTRVVVKVQVPVSVPRGVSTP